MNEETHDLIRGKGSFKLAMRGLQALLRYDCDVLLSFTPMKPNLHEVPDIIDFAVKNEIPVIQFPPLAYAGRAKENWEKLALSTEERLWFWKIVESRSNELDLLADCFSIDINRRRPFKCSIGSLPRIDPKGNVYPCQCFHSGYILGNAYEDGLSKILNKLKDVQLEVFQRIERIPECANCHWKNYCGGGCAGSAFNKNGTIFKPESCEVRRIWIEMKFDEIVRSILGSDCQSSSHLSQG